MLSAPARRAAADGSGFVDHGLMFCRPDGGPLHLERFSRTFSEQAAKAGYHRSAARCPAHLGDALPV
jgi:hypothetical protein